ncbi:MAG: DUF3108 domain-containing protein, partial [Dehalococcoidia bacterium]|nr:DUF3108 domain-containing protein [Dehalococcoidia bacterium]
EGVLTVERQDGELELTLRFVGGGISDESVVVVDAETIKPITVRRERQGEEVEVIEGEYDAAEEIVEVTEIGEDGDERLVPLRLEENSYDNESSLFLWRTIAFEEGYEASYHSVLANFRNTNVVTLNVVGKEQVTVPAGTFDTWRVEIQAGDVDQVAWFTDTPSHVLVQYNNSLQIFKLTEAPEGT